jgi:hypothetical protein
MIKLIPNTADNEVYLTLREAKKFLASFDTYLMQIENTVSGEDWFLILDLETSNERYSKAIISTNANDPLNSSILLEQTGQFYYTIFGQNSATNLDPLNTVGVVERGVVHVQTQQEYYNVPDITIPDAIIYYND